MTDTGRDHIPVGYVRRAHGIRGDVVVRGLVADASDRFVVDGTLTTGEVPGRSFRIVSQRMNGADYLLHLEGVESRDDAEDLVGTQFVIRRSERRDLGPEEWWVEDLVGCRVVAIDGSVVGEVVDVVVGAAQDRLVVETAGNRRGEIPFVVELVPDVDMDARRITVDLPEGLIE